MQYCSCSGAGYCNRDNVYKTYNAYKYCNIDRDAYIKNLVTSQQITLPNYIEQTKNIVHDTLIHIDDNLVNVSDEEFNKRMSICKSCPLFLAIEERCIKCGCYLNVKARWRSGQCPDVPPRW